MTGHRERLREKLLSNDYTALADYEVLELLLGYVIPRKDTKPLAKDLIRHFGNLGAVFSAKPEELKTIKGIKDMASALIRAVHFTHLHTLDKNMRKGSFLKTWDQVLDYYFISIRHHKQQSPFGLIQPPIHSDGVTFKYFVQQLLSFGQYIFPFTAQHSSFVLPPPRQK